MPLKLNLGLSRKVGEANYGSRGASVNLEMEVDGSLAATPSKLQERIRQLFGLVRTSLAEELNGEQPSAPAPRTSASSRRATLPVPATPSQVRALHAIARSQHLDLQAFLQEQFQIERPDDLSIKQASQAIDALKGAEARRRVDCSQITTSERKGAHRMKPLSSNHPPWLTVGIQLGLAAAVGLSFLGERSPRAPSGAGAAPELQPEQVRLRVSAHLDWADQQGQQAVVRQLDHLKRLFHQAKQQAPDFARAALGWGSKWRLLTDQLPWIGTEKAHERFLKECFVKLLFSPEDLERVLRQIVVGFGEELSGIEGQVLVKSRLDVAELSGSQGLVVALTPTLWEEALLPGEMAATQAAEGELRGEAVRGLLSLVVSEVLAQAAVRGGISAGMLSSGAGSGVVALGIGLAVGLVVDQMVSWIWDWACDPQGQLVRKLESWLDDLHRQFVEGDGSSPGLRQRLEALARDRATVRRAAIIRVLDRR